MRTIRYLFGFFPVELFYKLSAASMLFWVPALFFAFLANRIREQELLSGDVIVPAFLRDIAGPWLDEPAMLLTHLGGPGAVVLATMLLTFALAAQRKRLLASFVVFAVGSTEVINLILKSLFHRDRPTIWPTLVNEPGWSFPSGHAMASSALAFTVVALSWNTRWRWPVVAGAALYTAIVGFTRVHLGVHYPSDVLGGWCISLAWVIVLYTAMRKYANR